MYSASQTMLLSQTAPAFMLPRQPLPRIVASSAIPYIYKDWCPLTVGARAANLKKHLVQGVNGTLVLGAGIWPGDRANAKSR